MPVHRAPRTRLFQIFTLFFSFAAPVFTAVLGGGFLRRAALFGLAYQTKIDDLGHTDNILDLLRKSMGIGRGAALA